MKAPLLLLILLPCIAAIQRIPCTEDSDNIICKWFRNKASYEAPRFKSSSGYSMENYDPIPVPFDFGTRYPLDAPWNQVGFKAGGRNCRKSLINQYWICD
uniref:Secretory peptide n=1 Tax=Steinernema glaseri TaxID=37863 RepID=A0A1I7ZLV3_9BILA